MEREKQERDEKIKLGENKEGAIWKEVVISGWWARRRSFFPPLTRFGLAAFKCLRVSSPAASSFFVRTHDHFLRFPIRAHRDKQYGMMS